MRRSESSRTSSRWAVAANARRTSAAGQIMRERTSVRLRKSTTAPTADTAIIVPTPTGTSFERLDPVAESACVLRRTGRTDVKWEWKNSSERRSAVVVAATAAAARTRPASRAAPGIQSRTSNTTTQAGKNARTSQVGPDAPMSPRSPVQERPAASVASFAAKHQSPNLREECRRQESPSRMPGWPGPGSPPLRISAGCRGARPGPISAFLFWGADSRRHYYGRLANVTITKEPAAPSALVVDLTLRVLAAVADNTKPDLAKVEEAQP